jgi:hypothetical protein
LSSDGESLVVVRLGQHSGRAPSIFEVLERAGLLEEVSEDGIEMVEAGALSFRVPRNCTAAVVLALECSGFAEVRAYEVRPIRDG